MSSAKFIPPSKKPLAIVRPSGTRPIKVGLFSEHKLDLQRKRNRNFPEPLPAGTCLHSFTEVRKLRTGETTSKKTRPPSTTSTDQVRLQPQPSVGSRFGKSRNVGKHRSRIQQLKHVSLSSDLACSRASSLSRTLHTSLSQFSSDRSMRGKICLHFSPTVPPGWKIRHRASSDLFTKIFLRLRTRGIDLWLQTSCHLAVLWLRHAAWFFHAEKHQRHVRACACWVGKGWGVASKKVKVDFFWQRMHFVHNVILIFKRT